MDNLDETKATYLAKGILDWPKRERQTDRYGLVNVGAECPRAYIQVGEKGKLIAKIIEKREVAHIGDLFRGITPKPGLEGEVLILGEGEFFVEEITDEFKGKITCMGVKPDDNRFSDWLDPHKLYKIHNQIVSLWFEKSNSNHQPNLL